MVSTPSPTDIDPNDRDVAPPEAPPEGSLQ